MEHGTMLDVRGSYVCKFLKVEKNVLRNYCILIHTARLCSNLNYLPTNISFSSHHVVYILLIKSKVHERHVEVPCLVMF